MPVHPPTRRGGRFVAAAFVALLATSCGSAVANDDDGSGGSSDTVGGIGRLPVTIPSVTFGEEITIDITLPAIEGEEVGTMIEGNRLLMVGDSLFAGLSPRFSNLACDQLVPLGWEVLVEAEPGRFVDFGRTVFDRRLDEGWDTFVIMFGTNYHGDKAKFADTLASLIEDAGDVPVVLLTTTVFREVQHEVNDVIVGFANLLPNVSLVDWATISTTPGVLSNDRIHPTNQGRAIMMAAIAQVLGDAPIEPGDCLASRFTDDSAVGSGSSSTVPNPGNSVPTTRAPSTTTEAPSSSSPQTTSAPGSTAPVTSSPGTSPPDTSPPATSSPGTSPPATSPPATSPPATSPPDSGGDD